MDDRPNDDQPALGRSGGGGHVGGGALGRIDQQAAQLDESHRRIVHPDILTIFNYLDEFVKDLYGGLQMQNEFRDSTKFLKRSGEVDGEEIGKALQEVVGNLIAKTYETEDALKEAHGQEIGNLNHQIHTLRASLETLNEELLKEESRRETAEFLNAETRSEIEMVREIRTELEMVREETDTLRVELHKARSEYHALRGESAAKDQTINELAQVVRDHQQQIIQLGDAIKTWRQYKADADAHIAELHSANQAYRDESIGLIGQRDSLEREQGLLRNQLGVSQSALVQADQDLIEQERRIDAITREKEAVSRDNQLRIREQGQRIEIMITQIADLTSQNLSLQSQLERSQAHEIALQKSMPPLIEANKEVLRILEESKRTLKKMISDIGEVLEDQLIEHISGGHYGGAALGGGGAALSSGRDDDDTIRGLVELLTDKVDRMKTELIIVDEGNGILHDELKAIVLDNRDIRESLDLLRARFYTFLDKHYSRRNPMGQPEYGDRNERFLSYLQGQLIMFHNHKTQIEERARLTHGGFGMSGNAGGASSSSASAHDSVPYGPQSESALVLYRHNPDHGSGIPREPRGFIHSFDPNHDQSWLSRHVFPRGPQIIPRGSVDSHNWQMIPAAGGGGAAPLRIGNGADPLRIGNGADPLRIGNGAAPLGIGNGAAPLGIGNGAVPLGIGNGAAPLGIGIGAAGGGGGGGGGGGAAAGAPPRRRFYAQHFSIFAIIFAITMAYVANIKFVILENSSNQSLITANEIFAGIMYEASVSDDFFISQAPESIQQVRSFVEASMPIFRSMFRLNAIGMDREVLVTRGNAMTNQIGMITFFTRSRLTYEITQAFVTEFIRQNVLGYNEFIAIFTNFTTDIGTPLFSNFTYKNRTSYQTIETMVEQVKNGTNVSTSLISEFLVPLNSFTPYERLEALYRFSKKLFYKIPSLNTSDASIAFSDTTIFFQLFLLYLEYLVSRDTERLTFLETQMKQLFENISRESQNEFFEVNKKSFNGGKRRKGKMTRIRQMKQRPLRRTRKGRKYRISKKRRYSIN